MRVSVLGATEVWRGEQQVDLGTRKRRALVAALALSGGRPVSVDALVAMLWGDAPPDTVAGTLQVYVSGLRRVLEPERAPRAPATVLVTVTPGYALRLPPDAVDASRFDRAVNAVQRRMGHRDHVWSPPPLSGEELEGTLAELDAALGLWRGTPYVELEDAPAAVAERVRLEELRVLALEDRAVAALALGEHRTVAAELETLAATYPLREQLWALRALALARSGRQADALDVLRQVRDVLDTELGLEPGADLRDLQTALLRQDPALDWARPEGGVPTRRPAAVTPDRSLAPEVAPRLAAPALPAWPLVGRGAQLAALTSAYGHADDGVPTFVALTGEPGIGKSRLCAELAGLAAARGARLLFGRCSQDDGAPPLWPWQQVLRGLGEDLPAAAADDEGAEFRTWESIVQRVRTAAACETIVLVLDDLHWADRPTLRVLRLLLETTDAGRLLVLTTWRSHPEPAGDLADVAEALARRHAERLPLVGLSSAEAAQVVTAVTQVVPTGDQAAQLTTRTDGNPFFIVEYARLAHEGGDLGALMTGADPPTAVSDVLGRRLERLPEESRAMLRWAAVIGREFELPVLAEVAGVTEDDVLDRLDPALSAGLLREDGIGRYLFGHALVRDAVYTGVSVTRRARAHARVAVVLEEYADRGTEVARHWLAAGPDHAGRAWRAASAAAAEVMRTRHAYGTATDLLDAGLAALADDPAATPEDHYRLLMERTDTHRWQGDWVSLLDTATRAIEVATDLDDVRRLARAASSMTRGALWQSPAHGADHPVVLAALRRSLAELPSDEHELRCRVMLALAAEAYYVSPAVEREALVEEALALAQSIGDEALPVHACQIGFVATWRPATAARRLELGLEAAERAARLGDERSVVVAQALCAVAHGELGQVADMWRVAVPARAEAVRLHLPYAQLVLDALLVSWLAEDGRFEEAEELVENTRQLSARLRLVQAALAEIGAIVSIGVWRGEAESVADMMEVAQDDALPMEAATVVMMWRAGREDRAREFAATAGFSLDQDNWFSMLNWCCAAEAALVLGDRDLAVAAYDRLAPFPGYSGCAGSGTNLGPVDAFLALAAAAVGDRELADRHAEDALALCETWQIPLVAQWLRGQRDRYSF
ncbi:MAG: BTAD domain-containing putative transcriptional regulator [Nocardioides sp.]